MCEIDWTAVTSFSKEMLTPLIAAIALYIAWQQKKINKQKLDLDKYDRRQKVYDEVTHFIRTVIRTCKATDDDLLQLENAISQADFLFEPALVKYLEEINDHGFKLQYWNNLSETTSRGHDVEGHNHAEVVAGINSETKWLTHQRGPLKQKFIECLYIGG